MTKTFFADRATIMSPRTAKYVEAMVREGFDYNKWLKRVREEEAQAKQAEATETSGEGAVSAIDKLMSTPDGQHGRSNPTSQLLPKISRVPRALRQPHRHAKSQTPKARLIRWLEKVRRASGEFQTSRSRDAVYDYLESVFTIVMHYKVRRRTNRLLRHAFGFANLPFDGNADPYVALIRCTSKRDIDNKMISKYARALRFAAARKKPLTSLKRFMKKMGGLNAVASLYAKQLGRNNRVAAI